MLTRDLVRTPEASAGTPFRAGFEPIQPPEVLSDQRCTVHTIGIKQLRFCLMKSLGLRPGDQVLRDSSRAKRITRALPRGMRVTAGLASTSPRASEVRVFALESRAHRSKRPLRPLFERAHLCTKSDLLHPTL